MPYHQSYLAHFARFGNISRLATTGCLPIDHSRNKAKNTRIVTTNNYSIHQYKGIYIWILANCARNLCSNPVRGCAWCKEYMFWCYWGLPIPWLARVSRNAFGRHDLSAGWLTYTDNELFLLVSNWVSDLLLDQIFFIRFSVVCATFFLCPSKHIKMKRKAIVHKLKGLFLYFEDTATSANTFLLSTCRPVSGKVPKHWTTS